MLRYFRKHNLRDLRGKEEEEEEEEKLDALFDLDGIRKSKASDVFQSANMHLISISRVQSQYCRVDSHHILRRNIPPSLWRLDIIPAP
jgi:TRAP-type uncharacterized transport system substrate-binding protein